MKKEHTVTCLRVLIYFVMTWKKLKSWLFDAVISLKVNYHLRIELE
jgi:hypothetical protein